MGFLLEIIKGQRTSNTFRRIIMKGICAQNKMIKYVFQWCIVVLPLIRINLFFSKYFKMQKVK